MPGNLRFTSCVLTVALLAGCYAPDPPVTNESVAEAWQRADQAVARADDADRQLWHVQRLREIDRLHFESELGELRGVALARSGLFLSMSLLILVLSVALAVQRRRIRMLRAGVQAEALPSSISSVNGCGRSALNVTSPPAEHASSRAALTTGSPAPP